MCLIFTGCKFTPMSSALARVSQITPKSSYKAVHLPNWAPWDQNQPKKMTKSENFVKIFLGWFWPHGAPFGKWTALSHDVGVNRDTVVFCCFYSTGQQVTKLQKLIRFRDLDPSFQQALVHHTGLRLPGTNGAKINKINSNNSMKCTRGIWFWQHNYHIPLTSVMVKVMHHCNVVMQSILM